MVGAFERRIENETRTARAMRTAPIELIIMPSSVHSEYFELENVFGGVNKLVGCESRWKLILVGFFRKCSKLISDLAPKIQVENY